MAEMAVAAADKIAEIAELPDAKRAGPDGPAAADKIAEVAELPDTKRAGPDGSGVAASKLGSAVEAAFVDL